MKKIPELKSEEEIAAFCDVHQLGFEMKEAKEQIEAGEYISIDEAFDQVIAKYDNHQELQ